MKLITVPTNAGHVDINPAQIAFLQPHESNTLVIFGNQMHLVALEPIALLKQRIEGLDSPNQPA